MRLTFRIASDGKHQVMGRPKTPKVPAAFYLRYPWSMPRRESAIGDEKRDEI